jgi:hypothetical protein
MGKPNRRAVILLYIENRITNFILYFTISRFPPFFSGDATIDRRLRVMITKHVKHGEVYVLASEKKFLAAGKSCRKILTRHLGIFDFSVLAKRNDQVTASLSRDI